MTTQGNRKPATYHRSAAQIVIYSPKILEYKIKDKMMKKTPIPNFQKHANQYTDMAYIVFEQHFDQQPFHIEVADSSLI